MNLHQIPFFLPTMYGDIRLTAQGSSTEIEWEGLSPTEREALTALASKYDFAANADTGKVLVDKPIAKIETVLAKAMKRGRKLLSAVVFKNGRIEEIHLSPEPHGKREPQRENKPVDDYTMSAIVPASAGPAVAAVTVAQPTIGCPIPEFERADVRATRVLQAFLSVQQLADFERTQSFLVTGGDTGHQYVLTSRQAPQDRLARVNGRSVFDLNERRDICVHDWIVPAAEELLELKLFLEIPGKESYVRGLAEAE